MTQDRAAPVERLAVPTLVVTSEHDSLYPPRLARAMPRASAGAELVEIRTRGMSSLEQPTLQRRARGLSREAPTTKLISPESAGFECVCR